MKLSNMTLVNMINTLAVYENKKLPQKISYAITKNQMNASKEYQVYNKQLEKLINAYSDYYSKDKDGNVKKNDNGIPLFEKEYENKAEEFAEQLSDLLNVELDLNFYYIKPEVFDYEGNDKFDALSAKDILVLQSILCEPEKVEENNDIDESVDEVVESE